MSLNLTIYKLTLKEVKELLELVRKIEEEDPSRVIVCWIGGLEGKSLEEARKILCEVFPKLGVAG